MVSFKGLFSPQNQSSMSQGNINVLPPSSWGYIVGPLSSNTISIVIKYETGNGYS